MVQRGKLPSEASTPKAMLRGDQVVLSRALERTDHSLSITPKRGAKEPGRGGLELEGRMVFLFRERGEQGVVTDLGGRQETIPRGWNEPGLLMNLHSHRRAMLDK